MQVNPLQRDDMMGNQMERNQVGRAGSLFGLFTKHAGPLHAASTCAMAASQSLSHQAIVEGVLGMLLDSWDCSEMYIKSGPCFCTAEPWCWILP